jgi:hypothetical protein
MRSASAIIAILAACRLVGAEAAPPAPAVQAPPAGKPAKAEPSAATIPDEEKWIFETTPGRPDIFVDIEAKLTLERKLLEAPAPGTIGQNLLPGGDADKIEAALEWGGREAERIEAMVLARKWDDAIAASDAGIKAMEKYLENSAIQELVERFKRYKQQAEEAKIYEEAQAKFDALGLKVEGILWSPDGSLAVISGEPRALRINDRSKDCVIINIDTNRVDFLFHYKRRRFEFQRYVGEDVRAARAAR